jgi:cell division protease FtsH
VNKRIGVVAIVAALGCLAAWQLLRRRTPPPNPLSYSLFLNTVERSPEQLKPHSLRIAMGVGHQAEITGRWLKDDAAFVTAGYLDEVLLAKLARANLEFEMVSLDGDPFWPRLLLVIVPVLVIVGLFLFIGRSRPLGNRMFATLLGSKAKRSTGRERVVTFGDVAGIDEARAELEEITTFLGSPEKFTRLGGRIPKGVLLMGPPGTGKTLLARAIAGEAGVPFFSISGSDFVEMFVGVGASRVRALFEEGKKSAPCIIFIDELDAVGRQRGTGLGGGHDEREQTLNQLLVEMDGFQAIEGVMLVAATNRPDVLDPALLRPGRFDRRLVVPRPDVRGREAILNVHTRATPLARDVDLAVIARGTSGFVGADLEHLVNEAALIAARGDKNQLEMNDFELAKDKVLMGPERRSLVISPADRRAMAYHEAGHALVGKMMKASDPIHKVTIIPRGRALGLTQQLPTEDRLSVSEQAAQDQITIAMGGRVSEEITFAQITTGAADDLAHATDIARRMVCEWGMSDRIGPVNFARHAEMAFVGRDFGDRTRPSQSTAAEIDSEISRIVLAASDRAKKILLDHRPQLQLLAEALLEHETITGVEIDLLLAGKKLDRAARAS